MKERKVLSVLLKAILLIALCAGAIMLLQGRPANYRLANNYATSDVTYADGSTAHFDDKNFGWLNNGDIATLHINLPEEPFFTDSMLLFYDYNAVTEVWCGSKLLTSYGRDIAAKNMMIGNRFFKLNIPDEAWGGEITVTVRAVTDKAFSNFTNLRIYPSQYVYEYFFDTDPFGFICSIVIFILAFAGILLCIFCNVGKEVFMRAMCLISTMLLVSLWIISNEGIYTFFGYSGYFWQPLEYMAGYGIPIPVLLFYRGMADKKSRWYKTFGFAAAAVAVFFVISTVLNFTNIVHFDSLMGLAGVLLVTSGILLFIFTARMKIQDVKAKTIIKIGMYFFLLSSVYEVFLRTLLPLFPTFSYVGYYPLLALGAAVFLFCCICAFFSDLFDTQAKFASSEIKANALNEVIAQTPTGICQFKLDEELTIIAANDIFYQIMGYTNKDFVKDRPTTLYKHLNDEEKVFAVNAIKDALKKRKDFGELEINVTDIYNKPLTAMVKYNYDRDKSGNVTINVIDITERKQMEEELRIREESYRIAIDASDHYYFNFNAETKTCAHMFDAEALFGISEKLENIPDSLIEHGICSPESVADCLEVFAKFESGVPEGDFCLHLQNIKTHELKWYAGAYRTIFSSNGAPLNAVFAFRDVTEQHEQEIAYKMHHQKIEACSEDEISYYEINITTGVCEYHYGKKAKQVYDEFGNQWDEILDKGLNDYIALNEMRTIGSFLKCVHLLDLYISGITEISQEYWDCSNKPIIKWIRASVTITSQMETHEVKAYCTIENIDDEKAEQLERQIEQNEARFYEEAYERLSSSVMYGVCKYHADENLSIVFANDIFYQMHGYASQEEAVEAGFTNVLFATPPFGRDIVRAAHDEYMGAKSRQMFETEYPSVDADGNQIWILCRGVYSPEEGIFNSSILDITDRKKAESALKISEERYKLALEQSGNVFFFFDIPTRTMRLSDQLAQTFGVPNEVDNMPENFIALGLLESESVENYRNFYESIMSGDESGETIISCHMRHTPEAVRWYRIAFSSIYDARKNPVSAIITYEDLTAQYKTLLAANWKQLNLVNIPKESYAIAEYDLTRGIIFSQVGGLFKPIPDSMKSYDEINAFVITDLIYEDDKKAFANFLDRERLLKLFQAHVFEDSIEYRSLQNGSSFRWTRMSLQMIQDPYNSHVMGQFLFLDIHEEKTGQMELKKNMAELRKELENSRIKIMINQMQPHFLYNALSAIRTITKRDPDYAYDLLYDFTTHLRGSIKALSSDEPIPFEDELKNVKAYLNIEKMRFGDSLKVVYDIECDDFAVTPLTIQPLAENVARHGVYPKGDEGGTITIRSYEDEKNYIVEVEDDGLGFDVDEVLKANRDSVGLKSLIFRLNSLMGADVSVVSKKGVGTKATVKIPKNAAEKN